MKDSERKYWLQQGKILNVNNIECNRKGIKCKEKDIKCKRYWTLILSIAGKDAKRKYWVE